MTGLGGLNGAQITERINNVTKEPRASWNVDNHYVCRNAIMRLTSVAHRHDSPTVRHRPDVNHLQNARARALTTCAAIKLIRKTRKVLEDLRVLAQDK
jgi:hypothetical protein